MASRKMKPLKKVGRFFQGRFVGWLGDLLVGCERPPPLETRFSGHLFLGAKVLVEIETSI